MASPKLAAGDGSYDFHLRSLSAASRDSAAAADPASDPKLLQSVRRMVARAFPVVRKLFLRCAAAPTLSTASSGMLLLERKGSEFSESQGGPRKFRRRSRSAHSVCASLPGQSLEPRDVCSLLSFCLCLKAPGLRK
ncbi:hypothetical protein BRADI_5g22854v3 [Brachypodium distachyon]|uniref:Uncharacterized protein n=1 Tax=Brachypodium distachyon TaxID=15368 RepID=A0A0Q3EAF6_BRADI|nr:hypothetical protein BRADI_5g22854v3 [Brachypodium distachyon]